MDIKREGIYKMICESCGNEQTSGKFCGKCGTMLTNKTPPEQTSENIVEAPAQEASAEAAAAHAIAGQPQHPTEPNVHVEKVKETSKAFLNYFLHYLKHPSHIFQNQQQEFANGLISIALFAVIVGITFYNAGETFLKLLFEDAFLGSDYILEAAKPSFMTVFPKVVIFILLSMAVVVFSLFVINRFFGPGYSFKEIVTVYGTHLIPFIIVLIFSFLLLLLKSYTVGNILLIIGISYPISTMPLYIIGRYLSKRATGIDPLYSFFSYIILVTVLTGIIIAIVADSVMGNLLDTIKQFENLYY